MDTTIKIPTLKADKMLAPPAQALSLEDAHTQRLYKDACPATVEVLTDHGTGSGFFADKDHHVLTAAHVVLDANEISVVDSHGKRYKAKIEKLADTSDVAELTLMGFATSQPYQPSQPYLAPSDSVKMQTNDAIFALGYPKGYRPVYLSPGRFEKEVSIYDMVDKDAIAKKFSGATDLQKHDWLAALSRSRIEGHIHLEPGNSGGPLLDNQGKLIGMSDFIKTTDHAKSFFVPAADLRRLLDDKEPQSYYENRSTFNNPSPKQPFDWRCVDFN